MVVNTSTFGYLPDGSEAKLFQFITSKGLEICITNLGGIITSLKTPDKYRNIQEITAGFQNLNNYLEGHPHFGVIVGRFANRIARGKFNIDNKEYVLPINNSPNHLHGGDNGFHTKLWDYELNHIDNQATLRLNYLSADLEEGYPGNLNVNVTYTINEENDVTIDFVAKTDKSTHVNLTSHCYFNLSGFKNSILDHKLFVNAKNFVEINQFQIPTGKLLPTKNTLFDFCELKSLEESVPFVEGGIDHCYSIDIQYDANEPSANLVHEESGRTLSIYQTQPGLQVYTGNSLDSSLSGHNKTVYHKQWAICLEPQFFPDSPNQPDFPSTLLKTNDIYKHQIRLVFGVMD
jgi:aldose 1-epimerase